MRRLFFITGAIVLIVAATAMAAEPVPTESFRMGHAEVKEQLEQLDVSARSLATLEPAAAREKAATIVKFLNEHILAHAEWEEARLYPVVDRRTHAGKYPFTATMRHEHRIIGRWIRDLEKVAVAEPFDPVHFSSDTSRILGLLTAHFEQEEVILLPILDRTMTKAEVERELGPSMH